MASYYHEARAAKKQIKELGDENKRRAERKAEIAGAQVHTRLVPMQQLKDLGIE